MKRGRVFTHAVLWLLVVVMVLPPWTLAQDKGGAPSTAFSKEQLEQILAPIALYPDDLIVQILMASTYPIEVVQTERWLAKNKDLKGDALAKALEKQTWDPSVKSLVNFPQVLTMMSEKLDWTDMLGNAFLAQEKDVMDTVQVLRRKANAEGNLKTTPEQKVIVEKETIVIQPSNPEVVYVPTYNPTVVYGAWPYPAYPPYSYYPPGYVPGAALFSFGMGLALGAAWGYAWGGANWGGGDININSNRNANFNRNIDRGRQGQGKWQHDASHRKGAAYRDSATAKKFGQSSSRAGASSREARGFGQSRGGGAQARDMSGPRGGAGQGGGRQGAFSGAGNGGFERSASQRGQASRSQSRGGGGGGGGRGGGGGGRGGGRR